MSWSEPRAACSDFEVPWNIVDLTIFRMFSHNRVELGTSWGNTIDPRSAILAFPQNFKITRI